MSNASPLLNEIEDYLKSHPIAESTFGRIAVNDGKFVRRLRGGGRTFKETEDRVRDFMRRHPAPPPVPAKEGVR